MAGTSCMSLVAAVIKTKKRALPWHLEVQLSLKLAAAVTDAACSVKNHHRNTQDVVFTWHTDSQREGSLCRGF